MKDFFKVCVINIILLILVAVTYCFLPFVMTCFFFFVWFIYMLFSFYEVIVGRTDKLKALRSLDGAKKYRGDVDKIIDAYQNVERHGDLREAGGVCAQVYEALSKSMEEIVESATRYLQHCDRDMDISAQMGKLSGKAEVVTEKMHEFILLNAEIDNDTGNADLEYVNDILSALKEVQGNE